MKVDWDIFCTVVDNYGDIGVTWRLARQLVAEQGGAVVIDCQFCNERYSFDAADVAQLFAGGGSQAPADTRH